MVNEKISLFGIISIMYFLMNGLFLGIAEYNMFSFGKEATLFCSFIGFLIGIVIFYLFSKLIKRLDGKTIFEYTIFKYGKLIGNIFNFILCLFALFLAFIELNNLITFINIFYMPETSKIFIGFICILPVIYALSKGINSISKLSSILIFINLFIYILIIIGIYNKIDISNLKPFINYNYSDMIISSLNYTIFSMFPLFLLTSVSTKEVYNFEIKKIFKGYIIGNILLIGVFFIVLSVLGYPIISILKYPEYITMKETKIFGIIERIENTISMYWIFSNLITIIMSLFFVFRNFKNYKYNKYIIYFLGILILMFALFLFPSANFATKFNVFFLPIIFGIGIFFFAFV